MEKLVIAYSLKDILCPTKNEYLHQLTRRILDVIIRIRWDLHWLKTPLNKPAINTYGFRTVNKAPMHEELRMFKNLMWGLLRKVKFRKVRESHDKEMRSTIKEAKKGKCVLIKGDKSPTYYKVSTAQYHKLMRDAVTKEYKRVSREHLDIVNFEARKIADNLGIANRVPKFSEGAPFLTIKDHKEDFPRRIKTRWINPAKSCLGVVSKAILEGICKGVKKELNLNLCQSSREVIRWFNLLTGKESMYILKFDIENYYPSITKELFETALNWAKNYVEVSKEEELILENARKSFVVWDEGVWEKKTGINFDIAMGAFDGWEATDLVGLYILWRIGELIPELKVVLYRDDGLEAAKWSGPVATKKKKKLEALFKELGLGVVVDILLESTDFFILNWKLGGVK